ncbi:hypothetical protein BDV93DRAFT_522700 [Ceratobasidium sp. AG-I]|nr:hypothetical protein BDV93DRAFT_522700 [Ceratobasidium sp. AG-I]
MSSDDEGQPGGHRGQIRYGNASGSPLYAIGSNVIVKRNQQELEATVVQWDPVNRIYWVRFPGNSQPAQVLDTQVVRAA